MNIGSMISFYRKYQSLTQGELAQGICSQGEISLIEKGLRIPSIEMVNKISTRLGVSMEVFEKKSFYAENEFYINTVLHKLELLVNNRDYEKMPPYLNDEILENNCTNPLTMQCFLCYRGIYTSYGAKQPKKALEIYRQALQETNVTAFSTILDFPSHKDIFSKTETLLISGAASCFYLLNEFEKAEILFKVAYKNISNIEMQLSTQILGTIHYNACKNLKALKKYPQAIEVANEGLRFEAGRKTIYRSSEMFYELGEIYYLQEQFALAEKYYLKSMYLSYSTNNSHFFPLLLTALKQKSELKLLQENIATINKIA